MSLHEENNLNDSMEDIDHGSALFSFTSRRMEKSESGECDSGGSATLSNPSELGQNDVLLHLDHRSLYKYIGPDGWATQERRRQMFLDNQKKKRSKNVDEKRDLNEIFMGDKMEVEKSGEDPACRPKKKRIPFKARMMNSEWFTHLPDDLQDNWLVKFCISGIRVLVIATKGKTTCYLKRGNVYSTFKSRLPGGNREDGALGRFTILDCIYNTELNVIFVYDVIAWNSLSLIDLEAQHRFSWLKSKFHESPGILTISEHYNFKFVLVDCYPAQQDLIQEQLFSNYVINDVSVPFHSILFYHKEGHYVFECSPLVGWLRIFMLPEVLNIDVPELHVQDKPSDYVSMTQYIIGESQKKSRKIKNKTNYEVEMISMEQTN